MLPHRLGRRGNRLVFHSRRTCWVVQYQPTPSASTNSTNTAATTLLPWRIDSVSPPRRLDLLAVVFDDFDDLPTLPLGCGQLLAHRRRYLDLADRQIRKQAKTEKGLDFVGAERHLLKTLHPHLVLLRQLAHFVETFVAAGDDQAELFVLPSVDQLRNSWCRDFCSAILEMIGDDDVALLRLSNNSSMPTLRPALVPSAESLDQIQP